MKLRYKGKVKGDEIAMTVSGDMGGQSLRDADDREARETVARATAANRPGTKIQRREIPLSDSAVGPIRTTARHTRTPFTQTMAAFVNRPPYRRDTVPRLVTDWLRQAVIIAGLGSLLLTSGTAWAQGQTGYVLTTTNQLITIDVNNPGVALATVAITGITAGETLVGIDVRPENGYLYALGVNHTADTMSVYAISARTGVAAVVGAGGFTGAGNLPDPAVARYGVDFNPAVDRLRVTTNQAGAGPAVPGLNFRLNVTSGTLVAGR